MALNHNTFSRGTVNAVSADARKPPSVTANYLKASGGLYSTCQNVPSLNLPPQDPRDLEQKFTAMAALQQLIESKAMSELVNAKSFNGPNAVVPATSMLDE